MSKVIIAVVVATALAVGGILAYTYRQGIKVSTKICEEDKLRQELANKSKEVEIANSLSEFNKKLTDEASKRLEDEIDLTNKLQETINGLRNKETTVDTSYQCVPDSVLQDLRKLRLLRGPVQ